MPIRCETLSAIIKKGMQLFDKGGTRSDFLQRAYDFLMNIKSTNAESERAFSAAGLFTAKTRSCLGDETLNELYFLKLVLKVMRNNYILILYLQKQ